MQISENRKLTYTAMLTALAVVFNIFTFNTGIQYFMISFVALICFIAGVVLGPYLGFTVGFLGDLLGAIIRPLGPYLPLIGVASGMLGFIPGFIYRYFKGDAYVKAFVSALLCLIICTAGLNTYALFLAYSKGKTFFAYLAVRLPFQSITSAINLVASVLLCTALARFPDKRISGFFAEFTLNKVKPRDAGDVVKSEVENRD